MPFIPTEGTCHTKWYVGETRFQTGTEEVLQSKNFHIQLRARTLGRAKPPDLLKLQHVAELLLISRPFAKVQPSEFALQRCIIRHC